MGITQAVIVIALYDEAAPVEQGRPQGTPSAKLRLFSV